MTPYHVGLCVVTHWAWLPYWSRPTPDTVAVTWLCFTVSAGVLPL